LVTKVGIGLFIVEYLLKSNTSNRSKIDTVLYFALFWDQTKKGSESNDSLPKYSTNINLT